MTLLETRRLVWVVNSTFMGFFSFTCFLGVMLSASNPLAFNCSDGPDGSGYVHRHVRVFNQHSLETRRVSLDAGDYRFSSSLRQCR